VEIRVLGSGASMGVPVMGCTCGVCRSLDPRNHRLRSSALVTNQSVLLIDCGPDLRQQALRAQLRHIDAVLVTHAHMDHIGGMDDLRGLAYGRSSPLPIFCHQDTAAEIAARHHYMFSSRRGHPPLLALHPLEGEEGEFSFQTETIRWIRYDQLGCTVLGYRIGNFAYLTDIKSLPKGLVQFLHGVDTLVLSALQFEEHPYFLSIAQAVALAQQLQIPLTWLTHLAHEIDTPALGPQLPDGVRLAYDGAIFYADG
jgi:phosphoribosyl 1,2-cyclic phosphate phosphodiesterase